MTIQSLFAEDFFAGVTGLQDICVAWITLWKTQLLRKSWKLVADVFGLGGLVPQALCIVLAADLDAPMLNGCERDTVKACMFATLFGIARLDTDRGAFRGDPVAGETWLAGDVVCTACVCDLSANIAF